MRRALVAALLVVVPVTGCSKTQAPGSPAAPGSPGAAAEAAVVPVATDDDAAVMDAREAAQWAAAKDGDPEELMRLADLVKCDGLHEGAAARGGDRLTALRAAQYCDDFSELPWLVEVATTGSDGDAKAALDAIVAQAARRRRPVDPEDADELHAGCAALLALAGTKEAPKARRAPAVSALRMLVDYGCVKKEQIPGDLDAK